MDEALRRIEEAHRTKSTFLDLSDLGLDSLPPDLFELTHLTSLDLAGNKLTDLPADMAELQSLSDLTLNGNPLGKVPTAVAALEDLIDLGINGCGIMALPDWMARLSRLSALWMQENGLVEVPAWIDSLKGLTHLDMRGNRLHTLPASFARLRQLLRLRLTLNRFTEVPAPIFALPNLSTLEVDENYLDTVPDDISRLTRLVELSVQKNQIRYLPGSLADLRHLEYLEVAGNPLVSPPPEIAVGGSKSIIEFLKARRAGVEPMWASKVLVVGEGGVGKTSLVKALAGTEYDHNEPSTHGIRIEHLDLPHPTRPGVEMQLNAWDFGGQEIYHATHQFFLSNRSLFLLVWNARHGWEQGRLRYWLDIIKARAPESPVILVVTHAEDRPVDFPLDDLKREYPQIVISTAVDNRTRQGIDALRDTITEQAAKLPLMGAEWPKTWLKAAGTLWDCEVNRVAPDDMWQMMSDAGVEDPVQQRYIAKALHELGDILYYSEDPELCDTVILQPEWVNSYISKVLDSPEVEASQGLLTRTHLRELWRGLDRGTSDHFLSMMDKYDLSYRVDGRPDDVSLVVERLSWNPPAYQDLWRGMAGRQEIRVLYRLNTMPPGIPTWFIARSHRFSISMHWRTGAVLKHGDHLALVRADAHRKTVELTVRGPSPAAFFSILDDGLNRTLDRFPGLEIRREVPCRCDGECTELFNYDNLSKRLTKIPPKYTIECHRSGDDVDIRSLLLGLAPSSRDVTVMSLDQIDRRLIRIESKVDENAEYNQRMFMRLQHIAQTQQETRCPSVFALVQLKKRNFELHLYCEEPGAWHRLPEPEGVYAIKQPYEWVRKFGPHLQRVLKVLKYTAPLAGPVLGITVDQLSQQLKADCDLMKELVSRAPETFRTEAHAGDDIPSVRAEHDADFRALEAMLLELDEKRVWGGLSRTTTPEGLTLYLCSEHRKAY
ncbi:COR domain-containing protein [Kibdelosporangium aridum]|uniref:non-specific serine/threonine protein kinase n=1 Tax=Kibdelosporangium aridum TaxID=2030 RepID=A0A1Y5XPP2_KIBAR|nr:COR domain-containing protein [Kibdelosporangium aridum]SMD10279.1 Leucine Rich Repeat [Kibdelosporangium aridum]